ncbi:MAG: glycosyltransferase [Bacteroidota bacterium]|nr:glycosyltransferase [Bacteroidota bacterium]
MNFVSSYLANKILSNRLFANIPKENTGIIIIIPAFNEPGIIFTLNSLLKCKNPPCNVEIIVLVNAPNDAGISQIEQNIATCNELAAWKRDNKNAFYNMLFYDAGVCDNPGWGVGMARKMAMDEALRRFNNIHNPGGVIVSLDADCLVSENYLEEIYEQLYRRNGRKACSIYFEHPLTGDLPVKVYDAIARYELHLRYYYQALKYTGYPWAFHTMGSALAVKAEAYVKAGGMSKKQGAEDFYFIQKLVPAGGYFYLNSATVIPSPRTSDRVPFGTGPVITKIAMDDENEYMTYDPDGFDHLKEFFNNIMLLYNADIQAYENIYARLHKSMQEFLAGNDWFEKMVEISNNTASKDSFRKRFFNWFNMFRIVKYLNFTHSEPYLNKKPVEKAAFDLLEKFGKGGPEGEVFALLSRYREMER